jgi:hypothetical protein
MVMRIVIGLCLMVLLAGSVPASAQSPSQLPSLSTSGAHVALPWSLGPALPQGQMIRQPLTIPGAPIRDIWVPSQPVVVEAMVAMPAQAGSELASTGRATGETEYGVVRQSYVIPGYYVRETTVGFHYPERWMLDQSYTWRLLPAEFRPHGTVWNPGWPPAPISVGTLGSAGSPAAPMVVPSLR